MTLGDEDPEEVMAAAEDYEVLRARGESNAKKLLGKK